MLALMNDKVCQRSVCWWEICNQTLGLATQPASHFLLQARVKSSLHVAKSELPRPRHQTSGSKGRGKQHLPFRSLQHYQG